MSYCVQCGVQLAAGLDRCPLCQTVVHNPNQPACELPDSAHPDRIEEAISRMDLGYARQLSIILTLIPILTVLVLDLLDGGAHWSPYVAGALVLAWCFLAVPLMFPGRRPYLYVALDVLALCLYLALIAFMSGGFSWYLHIVLPLLVLVGGVTLLMLLVIRRLEAPKLYRAAGVALLLAGFILGLEVIVDLAATQSLRLGWSVYAAIPFVVLALLAIGLQNRPGLKEEIRKRLFI